MVAESLVASKYKQVQLARSPSLGIHVYTRIVVCGMGLVVSNNSSLRFRTKCICIRPMQNSVMVTTLLDQKLMT